MLAIKISIHAWWITNTITWIVYSSNTPFYLIWNRWTVHYLKTRHSSVKVATYCKHIYRGFAGGFPYHVNLLFHHFECIQVEAYECVCLFQVLQQSKKDEDAIKQYMEKLQFVDYLRDLLCLLDYIQHRYFRMASISWCTVCRDLATIT